MVYGVRYQTNYGERIMVIVADSEVSALYDAGEAGADDVYEIEELDLNKQGVIWIGGGDGG